ncbi:MAG: hypothetical protein CMP22_05295 [Rickettsiales bacterium]|nr:hypothetical protein [Rickettsiales bacterium]|tara:strand:- start:1060 stop:1872 length:813 start_codon:yes stop_codon:yes gene_type:complete
MKLVRQTFSALALGLLVSGGAAYAQDCDTCGTPTGVDQDMVGDGVQVGTVVGQEQNTVVTTRTEVGVDTSFTGSVTGGDQIDNSVTTATGGNVTDNSTTQFNDGDVVVQGDEGDVYNAGDMNFNYKRNPVNTAYSTPASVSDNCSRTFSIGVQTVGVGTSISLPGGQSEGCEEFVDRANTNAQGFALYTNSENPEDNVLGLEMMLASSETSEAAFINATESMSESYNLAVTGDVSQCLSPMEVVALGRMDEGAKVDFVGRRCGRSYIGQP